VEAVAVEVEAVAAGLWRMQYGSRSSMASLGLLSLTATTTTAPTQHAYPPRRPAHLHVVELGSEHPVHLGRVLRRQGEQLLAHARAHLVRVRARATARVRARVGVRVRARVRVKVRARGRGRGRGRGRVG